MPGRDRPAPRRAPRGDGSARIDIRLVSDPISFFVEEHMRQRKILADLDLLAGRDGPAVDDAALAAECLAHLREEVPIHARDEDDDLLPLLRRRARPEDELEPLIARLTADHAAAEERAQAVAGVLSVIAAGGAPTAEERALLAAHAAGERRHLIVENAIILPLARVRLTRADLRTLAVRMAARRGICLLPEEPDA